MTKKAELALFISGKIKASRRTQREIARDAGIPNSNFLSMIKTGGAKIPISRVPALADALGVHRADLLRRVLEADQPEMLAIIDSVLPDLPITADEIALLRGYRILRQEGVLDGSGVQIRPLRQKGAARDWATISK